MGKLQYTDIYSNTREAVLMQRRPLKERVKKKITCSYVK
jgi:hypothetical protein